MFMLIQSEAAPSYGQLLSDMRAATAGLALAGAGALAAGTLVVAKALRSR
jgi:hypothetical protein